MKDDDFARFMQLPYRIELFPAEEGGYVAAIPELPGCITQGETAEEALKLIDDAKAAWISTAWDLSITIPMPDTRSASYSGKLNVRMPRSLHRALARQAAMEGISLNSLIVYKLTRALDDRMPRRVGRKSLRTHGRQ
jgi:antitoxin HicB